MLRRRPMAAENSPTLGDLLKDKAEAGVKVCVCVHEQERLHGFFGVRVCVCAAGQHATV